MSAAGWWTLTLALAYTLCLVVGGRLAARRRAEGRDGFFVGGRSFGPWTVAFCITGLFSGSSYIAIVELSYRTGISAVWYGVAETIQILLIAALLVKPLRERLVVTVTGMIGARFGRVAAAIASVITAITFPMYSVATTIAFASALHGVTGLSLSLSVAATAVVLLAFLAGGGMSSVGFTQTMNVVAIGAMALVGVWALLASGGAAGEAALPARHLDLGGAGVPLIAAWFGTFLVNVPLAQAAFQMSMSARSPEDGQRGLLRAAAIGVPLILLGVAIGVVAAVTVPTDGPPLVAIAEFISRSVPPWAAGVFFLGLWACALGWAGPCQFSGATSLGRDLGRAIAPAASEAALVRATRVALLGLTALLIGFALLRSEQAAWWNVLAWTLRNGATLAPVLAVLFWPLATRRAAIAGMLVGFGSGVAWYTLSGFQPTGFALGVHPVWVGMSANLATLIAVTLVTSAIRVTSDGARRARGRRWLAASALIAVISALGAGWLAPLGLIGPAVLLALAAIFGAASQLAELPARELAATPDRHDRGATSVDDSADHVGVPSGETSAESPSRAGPGQLASPLP
ncbi:Sodium/pantothenate symporter [Pseudoclavibacter triregionum]|nr:Sodium/pantothenate symporter [Pseudoclavibacter triregionum]